MLVKNAKGRLVCGRCNSALFRFRVRTNDHLCNKCGAVHAIESTGNINDAATAQV